MGAASSRQHPLKLPRPMILDKWTCRHKLAIKVVVHGRYTDVTRTLHRRYKGPTTKRWPNLLNCDHISSKSDKRYQNIYQQNQEHHCLRIEKTNANNITQGLGGRFLSKFCVTGKLVTQTGMGSSAINPKSHSTPGKFNPMKAVSWVILPSMGWVGLSPFRRIGDDGEGRPSHTGSELLMACRAVRNLDSGR